MFKIVMISAMVILALAWIAYGIWRIRERIEEKKQPKPTTKHLDQVKKSFDEYTKKLEDFKKPKRSDVS